MRVEILLNIIRKQLLSLVLLQRLQVFVTELIFHSFETQETVGHLENLICLLDHLLILLAARHSVILFVLQEFMLDLVVHGFVSISSVLLGCHARALLFCEPNTVTVGNLILNTAVGLIINDFI